MKGLTIYLSFILSQNPPGECIPSKPGHKPRKRKTRVLAQERGGTSPRKILKKEPK
jgi:hypothetical protein